MQLLSPDTNQVHIWTIDLDKHAMEIVRCRHLLTQSEIFRANRYLDPQKKQRFILARAALRKVLSHYVGNDIASLDLKYGPAGKPYLNHKSGLNFNLSCSQNFTMIALSLQHEVGIDIQAIELVMNPESIAELVCSSSEILHLLSLNAIARQAAFTKIWVRKEAYLKALGYGFSKSASTFSVYPATDTTDVLYKDENNHQATKQWRLMDIKAPDGFCAALAARGRDWQAIEIEYQLDFLNQS